MKAVAAFARKNITSQ